jgi:predicted GNAT family N-acyltransferase
MFRLAPNIDRPKTIVIEMLARNFAARGSPGTGYDLLAVVERYIAHQLGIERINIEAVKDLEGYYESLGYEPTGENYYDSSWKEIINLSKKIE